MAKKEREASRIRTMAPFLSLLLATNTMLHSQKVAVKQTFVTLLLFCLWIVKSHKQTYCPCSITFIEFYDMPKLD